MSYALGILPRAQRELGTLPTETYQRLREAIFALARELSDKAKEALRVQAAQSGLSLEAHVRQILQQASTGKGVKPANILDLADKYFGVGKGIDLEVPKRGSGRKQVDFSS